MLYLLTAGKKALANAGMSEDVMSQLDKAKCGVLIGSAMGGMKVTFSCDSLYLLVHIEIFNVLMESSLLSALYGEQHFGHPAVILQLLDGTLHHGPHGCLSQVVAAWGPFNYHFSNAHVLCGIDPFFTLNRFLMMRLKL